jgi:hypothetical protein
MPADKLSGSSARPSVGEIVRSVSRAEQAAGGGSLVVIVSTLLTWKGVSAAGYSGPSVDGLHSWGLLTLLIAIIAVIYVIARSPFFRNIVTTPRLPVTDAAAYVIAGAGEIVTALLMSGHYTGYQTKFGFYIALVGGAITAIGGYLMIRDRGKTPFAPAGGRRTPAEDDAGLGGPPDEGPLGGPPLAD